MLSAVPAQAVPATPARPREEAFLRAAEDALQLAGPEALARIVQLYNADTRALSARIDGLAAEASTTQADARRHFTMLQQIQMTASAKLFEAASMSAELATYREMFAQLRRHADRANGTPVLWEDIAAVLSIEPMEPVRTPIVLAFVADDRFRGGQFVSHPEGDVTFVFTFVGWALIDHGPGANGVIEPMFLVEDRALPRSVIEHERHVRMDGYLPHLERHAA